MQSQSIPPPVFILAAPGLPGATLAAALGRNPVAYGLPELNLEQMETIDVLQREMTGIRAPQMHGLMRAIAHLYGGEQTAAAIEMAQRWMLRRTYLSTAAVARELAARIAPRHMVRPVTASIFDKASLQRLRSAFPDATYVHLHLHPHLYGSLLWSTTSGQVAIQLSGSIDESTDPPTPDPQELWLMAETALAAFLDDLPETRVTQLRVEDLLADPGAVLTGLAKRLGWPATGPARTAMLSPEQSVFAGPGPMGAHLASTIRSFDSLAASLPDPDSAALTGPLPWRPDGAGFRPEVRQAATGMGYA